MVRLYLVCCPVCKAQFLIHSLVLFREAEEHQGPKGMTANLVNLVQMWVSKKSQNSSVALVQLLFSHQKTILQIPFLTTPPVLFLTFICLSLPSLSFLPFNCLSFIQLIIFVSTIKCLLRPVQLFSLMVAWFLAPDLRKCRQLYLSCYGHKGNL